VVGVGFAELGHEVVFVEIDKNKIKVVNSGRPPIYEEGLKELMWKNRGKY